MHYLSPERPKIHYRPAFVTSSGKPVHVLCMPQIVPCETTISYHLIWWLPTSEAYTSSSHTITISRNRLEEFLEEYLENPELFIEHMLDYKFFEQSSVKQKKHETLKGVTLDDL